MTRKPTVVINKEGRWYVARSLELGVVSQGKSVEEAEKILRKLSSCIMIQYKYV